jgi:hypothetical protein
MKDLRPQKMLKHLLLFLRDERLTGAYGVLNLSGDTLRVRMLAMTLGREDYTHLHAFGVLQYKLGTKSLFIIF